MIELNDSDPSKPAKPEADMSVTISLPIGRRASTSLAGELPYILEYRAENNDTGGSL
jgi:hypothetical protein